MPKSNLGPRLWIEAYDADGAAILGNAYGQGPRHAKQLRQTSWYKALLSEIYFGKQTRVASYVISDAYGKVLATLRRPTTINLGAR
jgi:hypothetical protein